MTFEEAFSVNQLRALLDYDPLSGQMRWRAREGAPRFNGRYAGKPVGHINAEGYIQFTLSGETRIFYPLGHRLAAVLMLGRHLLPGEEVDHDNNERSDNRWLNLRVCSHPENGKNQSLFSSNSSGFKGVYFNKPRQKWLAQILVDGQRRSLGYHSTAAEGGRAYDQAAIAHFGNFARTNASMGLL